MTYKNSEEKTVIKDFVNHRGAEMLSCYPTGLIKIQRKVLNDHSQAEEARIKR